MDGKILDYDNLHYLTDSIILDIKKKEILEANPTYTTKIDNVVQTGNRFFETCDAKLPTFSNSLSNSSYPIVIFNDEVHIFYANGHYRLKDNTFTILNSCNASQTIVSAGVYNNTIYVFSRGNNNSKAYINFWDSTNDTWDWAHPVEAPFLLSTAYYLSSVVYDGKIHMFGFTTDNSPNTTGHYTYDGTNWVEKGSLPYTFNYSWVLVFDNKIHLLGSYNSSANNYKHYAWDGTDWESISTLPQSTYTSNTNNCIRPIVYNNKLYLFSDVLLNASHNSQVIWYSYVFYNNEWLPCTGMYRKPYSMPFVYHDKLWYISNSDKTFYIYDFESQKSKNSIKYYKLKQ